MAKATRRIERAVLQLIDAPLEQQVERFEPHPHPGLAVSGRGERQAGQVGQMFAGRVAVQDLQEEDLDRDDRIERRIVPRHACLATGPSDRGGREFFCPTLLEATNDLRNTTHGGVSCVKGTAKQQFQYAGDAAFFHAS